MSYVVAVPELLASAATDLADIGTTVGAANVAALGPTTAVLAAGADEVSVAAAALFAEHGQAYQELSTQVEAFHAQLVRGLSGAGSAYADVESANVVSLQAFQDVALGAINGPTQALLGRPLIGDGANGAPGQAGGAGGLLYGNGGNGGASVTAGVAGGA
ncbi:PE family protein, partial [Mycobacterium basiliense]